MTVMGSLRGFFDNVNGRVMLAGVFLLLASACSYHPPAPIEEHSGAMVKRQLNSDGSYYVRAGDTLYGIAFSYGLDHREVARWNNISSPFVIYPGQKLQLTAPSTTTQRKPGSEEVRISAIKSPGQTTTRAVTKPATPKATKPAPVAKPSSKSVSTASSKTAPTSSEPANTADPKSWRWPTRGAVKRTYVSGDPARNGLDIAGKEGQDVIASAAGQVVYSGNGLIGYGELIILKHSEKMLSAYAHNKVRLAHEGDRVSAGQKIAEMGRNSAGDQILHFEIRVRGKPVNPLNYLPKK